jgi:hypothetical protein
VDYQDQIQTLKQKQKPTRMMVKTKKKKATEEE